MTARILDRITGAIIGALALALVAVLAGVVNAGPLDPTGPPSSTLPQVEPRNPIPPVGWNGAFPIVINQPGSYFLTRNLTASSLTPGIRIQASHVHLDLNGFMLDGGDVGNIGVFVESVTHVTIENGSIRRWLAYGAWDNGPVTGSHYRNLQLEGNNTGLGLGSGGVVENCIARSNFGAVIVHGGGAIIRGCNLTGNTAGFIMGTGSSRALIENNQISVPQDGRGIELDDRSTVRGNVITSDSATYTSIDFDSSISSTVYENRLECATWIGNSADDVFPFDFANARTNVCQPVVN